MIKFLRTLISISQLTCTLCLSLFRWPSRNKRKHIESTRISGYQDKSPGSPDSSSSKGPLQFSNDSFDGSIFKGFRWLGARKWWFIFELLILYVNNRKNKKQKPRESLAQVLRIFGGPSRARVIGGPSGIDSTVRVSGFARRSVAALSTSH